MNIIYFGNRDYWDIKTNGHTRFENIFKSLVKLDKYQVVYARIFNFKNLINHVSYYLKNFSSIKVVFSNWTIIFRQIKSDKLIVLSIYTISSKNIISRIIHTIEDFVSIESRQKWIWFNSPFLWDKIKGVDGYKYYFDTVELYFSVIEYKHLESSITKTYNKIVKNIHLLTTISESGVKYFSDMNPELPIYLVRNGIDLNLFKPIKNREINRSKKVVGLIGNLNSNHEYKGLLHAAVELKNIRFIIIGKMHGGAEFLDQDTKNNLNRLFKLSNVEYHHWVPQNELPNFISRFDVGLITYKTAKNDPGNLLDTGDSLKKYQYLACNVPVISSNCQKIDTSLKKGIFIYYNEKELKSLIVKVLYSYNPIDYRELVLKYDWKNIINQIMDYVKKV